MTNAAQHENLNNYFLIVIIVLSIFIFIIILTISCYFYQSIDRQNKDGWTLLNIAAEHGHLRVVGKLIDCGASINRQNKYGWSPLNIAAKKGHLGVVGKLIDCGASIDRQNIFGSSPLNSAATKGHLEVVGKLIDCGASIDLQNKDGCSALHTATAQGHLEIARKLIECGASINLPNTHGCLAIHFAVEFDHSELIRLLIVAGADVNRKSSSGWTPLHLAIWLELPHIAVQLVESSALILPDLDALTATDLAVLRGSSVSYSLFSNQPSVLPCSASDQLPRHIWLLCCFGNADFAAVLSGHAVDPMSIDARVDITKLSCRLHESLSRSGFTRINAAVQSGTAAVLEQILRRRSVGECHLIGSFADGWGNCLSGICGQTDADSDMDVTVMDTRVTLHLAGTWKHRSLEKVTCVEVELSDGHVAHRTDSIKPNIASKGMTLTPSVDQVKAFPCCGYPDFKVFGYCYIPQDILKNIYGTQCHVVSAAPPGQEGRRMRVSTTLMERGLMHSLTTLQGQLFILLKYLIKRVIAKRVKGLKTYHAKNLLFYMLDRTPADEWQPQNLMKLLRQSLELLLGSLTDSSSSEQQCMRHFFMRHAAIYLRKDHEGRAEIAEVVRHVMDELPQLMAEFEQTLMKNSPTVIEFHPFLILPLVNELRIPESNEQFEYHQIYDAVRRALEMLGDEASHLQQIDSLLSRIPDCARTARESLRALLRLREENPIESCVGDAFSFSPSCGVSCPEVEQDDFFEFGYESRFLEARVDFVWNSLKSSDSAWKFMFSFARKPDLHFLPDHMRAAFPWKVPHRSSSSVYINFHALMKSLQLESRKLSGDEEGVKALLTDFGHRSSSGRLDSQELLMMLHYCSDEAKLVEAIHGNREMIVDTGLAGTVISFLNDNPSLRRRCVTTTWQKVENLIGQQRFSSPDERDRVHLVMRRAKDYLREKEGIEGADE